MDYRNFQLGWNLKKSQSKIEEFVRTSQNTLSLGELYIWLKEMQETVNARMCELDEACEDES